MHVLVVGHHKFGSGFRFWAQYAQHASAPWCNVLKHVPVHERWQHGAHTHMKTAILSASTCHDGPADPVNVRINDKDLKYYANGEDAYEMRKYFKKPAASGKKAKGQAAAGENGNAAAAAQ